jgi:hypothetical protein
MIAINFGLGRLASRVEPADCREVDVDGCPCTAINRDDLVCLVGTTSV